MSAQQKSRSITRRSLLQATGVFLGGTITGGWLTGAAYTAQTAAPLPALPAGVQVPPLSTTTKSGIRLHAIQTGFVAVKQAHRAFNGPDGLAMPAIATDRRWTEWLPIYTWVIEHPEGVIVIDTGESSRATDPDYFACDPVSRFIYRSFLRFAVTKEDEIGMQLAQLGIPPTEVRWVIQSHLHSDHADGMAYFPNSEFLIGAADYPNAQGTLPCHNPAWLKPTLVKFADRPYYAFDQRYPVTKDGAVTIIPTPGHSLAHQSVLLEEDNLLYCFAGDASFDVPQMQRDTIPGINADRPQTRATLARLRTLTQQRPTIYLPSHDPDAGRRLVEQVVVTA